MKKIILLWMALFAIFAGNAQTLTGVSPGEAEQGQKLSVLISGQNTNFTQGTNSVWFNQGTSSVIYPQTISTISDTEIEAEIILNHNQKIGDYDVTVAQLVNLNYESFTLVNGFKVLPDQTPPVLVSIPEGGQQGEPLAFTITGQNTHFTQATNTIYLMDESGSYYLYADVSPNTDENVTITTFLPYSIPTGTYSMCVHNYIDSTICKEGFHVEEGLNVPQLISVSPNTINNGETVTMTIKGQNTHFLDYNNAEYSFNTFFWLSSSSNQEHYIYPSQINVTDDETMEIVVYIPNYISAGIYSFHTYFYLDGQLDIANGIEIQSPYSPFITGVTPSEVKQGQQLPVLISGQNTSFSQGTNVVWFSQGTSTISVSNVSFLTNELLTGTISVPLDIAPGEYMVNVYNTNSGTIPSNVSIQILERNPEITNVTPGAAKQGQSLNVYISGNDTYFLQGTNTQVIIENNEAIYFADEVTAVTNGLIMAKFNIPADAAIGVYNVAVTDIVQGNMLYLDQSFEIEPAIDATAIIRGILVDNEDNPVPYYSLTINSIEGEFEINTYYVTTDENGRFELGELYPGLYTITGGISIIPATVTLEEGQAKEVTLIHWGQIIIEGTMDARNGNYVNIYPIPMDEECVIEYLINESGDVRIEVLNSRGEYLGTLKEGYMGAGVHKETLLADDFNTSGFYLIRIVTGETVVTKKVIRNK